MNNKNSKKVNRIKFLLFKIAIIIVFLIILFFALRAIFTLISNPANSFAVREGTISKEETDVGYIIRSESVVVGNNYKNGMQKIIDEGQKAAKGENIFRYYSNGEDDIKNKIADLDKQIEELMQNNTENLLSADTKLLNTNIESQLNSVNKLNSIQKISKIKKDLTESLKKKAEIAGDLSPKGSKLKELVNQRADYENQLSKNAEYISAPASGLVSYRVDGFEDTLNTSDFSKYNIKFLNNLNIKSGQIISESTEEGKIVDNYDCYIAFNSKTNEAKSAKVNDKVTIVLPSAKKVSAKIAYLINEDDGSVTMFFNINEGIEELLSYRKTSFDIIWWNATGYKVPNSSIITDNNLNYVIRTKNGYLERVLVKIKKQTDDYSIVTNYSSSEIKELNIADNAKTSIVLYDEILQKPTENQINSTK